MFPTHRRRAVAAPIVPALLLVACATACSRAPEAAPPAATPQPVDAPAVATPDAPAAADAPPATRETQPGTAPETQPAAGTPPEEAPPRDVPAPEPGTAQPGSAAPAPRDAVPAAPLLDAAHARALAAARELRGAGRRLEAAAALRDAEREHGESAVLRLEAAWCFFDEAAAAFAADGDPFYVKSSLADAHARVDQAARLAPDLPGSATLLAKILRYEEDPERARTVLTEHLARFPGDAAAHRELGDMCYVAQDWEGADTHLTRAAELDPADGRSRLHATTARQWLRAYPARVLHDGYRMAALLLPEEDEPLRRLAGTHPGDKAAQVRAFDEVIRDRPDAVWARIWKAYVLRQEPQPDARAALVEIEAARKLAPSHPGVLANLAEVLCELDRFGDAVAAYTDVVAAAEPGTVADASNALEALLHRDARAQQLAAAVRDRAYDALVRANPSDGRFGNNAGLWYRDVGRDYEKSLRYYQAALAAAPDDLDYVNDTAVIYLFHLRDRKDAALPMFLRVREDVETHGRAVCRGYWDALENLCKYWYEAGEYEKVLECAKLRANPSAEVDGRPYPSRVAEQYGAQALKKLGR